MDIQHTQVYLQYYEMQAKCKLLNPLPTIFHAGICMTIPLHVYSMSTNGHEISLPFWFDVGTCSDVVSRRKDKLVVQHPLRFVVEAGARVKLNNLEEESMSRAKVIEI